MTNRKPMYFDTLKKDSLYLLTPKLGNPTGDKTLLSPMYFPRNILEETVNTAEYKEKQEFLKMPHVYSSEGDKKRTELLQSNIREEIQHDEDEPA